MAVTVLDLETAPTTKTLDMEPPDAFVERGIQSRWKDETQEEHREKNRLAWVEEKIKFGSLDWYYGQIIAAGTMQVGLPRIHLLLPGFGTPLYSRDGVTCHHNEASLLEALWRDISTPLVGYNILQFDWPWLLGRSTLHGVGPSDWEPIRISRYGRSEIVDLMETLSSNKAFPWKKLDEWAAFYEFEDRKSGDAKDMLAQWTAGNLEWVYNHLLDDLKMTELLHKVVAPLFLDLVR